MIRNSSFELLRILLMVMIIIHHCIVHGLGLSGFDPSLNTTLVIPNKWILPACLSNCFCICAVNCFILISGYFGIRTNKKKFLFLLFALIFYSIILNLIPNLIEGNYKKAINSILFVSHSPYWFVVDYLFLMAFAPIINLAFERLPHKQLHLFISSLLIISIYFGFVWGHTANINGYTLLQFILMYCIGRIIKIKKYSIRRINGIFVYILSSALCGICMWILWKYGFPKYAWRMTYYNDPLIIISSISLFLVFKDIQIRSNTINTLAKSAFGIYLVQSSPFVANIIYSWIREKALVFSHPMGGGILLIFSILCVSIVISLLSIAIDKVRLGLSKFFF